MRAIIEARLHNPIAGGSETHRQREGDDIVLTPFSVSVTYKPGGVARGASSREMRRTGPVFILKSSGARGRGLDINVINLDAFVAAVLHPQQLAFGGVEALPA